MDGKLSKAIHGDRMTRRQELESDRKMIASMEKIIEYAKEGIEADANVLCPDCGEIAEKCSCEEE